MSSETPERIHFAALDPATGAEDTIVTGYAEGGVAHLDRDWAPYETLATVRKRFERRYDRAPNGCRDCGAEQRGHDDGHPYADPGDALRLARMKYRRDTRLNPTLRLRPADLLMTFAIDTSALSAAMTGVAEAMAALGERMHAAVRQAVPGLELDAARHWGAPPRAVCAHVCGPDAGHSCDARATTSLRFTLPSGGVRDLPLCEACADAENAATGGPY